MSREPVNRSLYLSHGGGPLPLLGDAGHREMVDNLQAIAEQIERPTAILVISAHWEEAVPTVTGGANPEVIYDYYGFPPPAYEIRYPASGEPSLARQVVDTLNDNGIAARLDMQRGFDHGLYVPLKIMYPEADIPCIQLSLVTGLDPEQHIKIGQALAALSHDSLLTIGSGFSFHNIKAFFSEDTSQSREQNHAFEHWLIQTCSNRSLDEVDRTRRLVNWGDAPGARYCHPREEHLLPLHVCYGVAERACSAFYSLSIMHKRASVYLWQ